MTEKTNILKDQVASLLQVLIQAATSTGEFIKDQIPLVIKELLLYNTVFYAVWLVVLPVFLFIALKCGLHCIRKFKDDPYSDAWGFGIAGCAVVAIILLTCTLGDIFDLIKIICAPRVWLIEYAARLVK